MKSVMLVVVAVLMAPIVALVLLFDIALAEFNQQDTLDQCSTPVSGKGKITGSGPMLAALAARAAGFKGEDLITAVAVAGAESTYNPNARNSIGASGLWQILESAHRELFAKYNWRDPGDNGVMAYSVWHDANDTWRPWTTVTSGAYMRFMGKAEEAVRDLGSAPAPPAQTCAPTPAQGAPRTFSGGSGLVDDPTTSGMITLRMLWTYTEIMRVYHWQWGVSCWDAHAWNPTSDHPKGQACDFTVGKIGVRPNPSERAIGWQLAKWLRANASLLGVKYVIFDGRIWTATQAAAGWRNYSGGGVYDPSNITGGHFDHVHVSVI